MLRDRIEAETGVEVLSTSGPYVQFKFRGQTFSVIVRREAP